MTVDREDVTKNATYQKIKDYVKENLLETMEESQDKI